MKQAKVQFLVVGAQKSGTSALDAYLRTHPNLQLAERKEAHFFDTDNIFNKNPINYHNYHRLFADVNKVWGECTPNYLYWHESMRRIYEYNPDMKLIAVLRDPIQRAYSAWNMEVSRGSETLGFREAIQAETKRCRSALPTQHRRFSYIDRGFYSEQIRRMWRYFPRSQTLILKYDDFKFDFSACLHQISAFLAIDAFTGVEYEQVNANQYAEKIAPEDWAFLAATFKHEIAQLELMLDWNCKSWLDEKK